MRLSLGNRLSAALYTSMVATAARADEQDSAEKPSAPPEPVAGKWSAAELRAMAGWSAKARAALTRAGAV